MSRKLSFIFLGFLVLGLFALQPAPAGAATPQEGLPGPVLVLPFQINAGSDMAHLNAELPALLVERLAARGIPVMPMERVQAILQREKISTLDLATVRRLLRNNKGAAAIYGSYNQLGTSFSIDARLVPAAQGEAARQLFVEQDSSVNLLMAVEELAVRVAADLNKGALISRVEVRGANALDPAVVLNRINTKAGDPLDMRVLDAEFKRIWDLGFFSDLTVELEETDDGLHLIYTVMEKPRVQNLVIKGNSEVEQEEILAVMTTRTGSVLNEKVLAADLQKINEIYRKQGYYLAKIDYDLQTRSNNTEAVLTLDIEEGNRLYIKEIRFEGAEKISPSELRGELALQERGIFSWITGTGVLKEELLERDVSVIGTYYMNKGFMDVAVGHPNIEYEDDGIAITYRVNEGPRYKVGLVKLAGELIDSDAELEKIIVLDDLARDHEFFSLSSMQNDVQKLGTYYAEYGYAYANVTPRPQPEEEEGAHFMNMTYFIEKKQKVYVRNIIIEGNSHTRDNVILREMRLTDGDEFNGKLLGRSMQRLNNLGYFELAESELVPTQDPNEVDLKIKVVETETGAIMAGIGYSSYSSFGVSGTIQETNLWGKGYVLRASAMTSGRRTAYDVGFTNPRVNDTLWAYGIDLYSWEDDFYDYDKDTLGATFRVGHPVGEYSYITAAYRMEFYKLYDFDDDASPLITQYEGNRMASVASLRLSRNTTNRIQPTDGTSILLAVDYGGGLLAGDDDFIKVIGEFNAYKKLTDHHVLHFRTRGGALFENGDDTVPVYERFWMGGMESVRGYASRDIVPRDPDTGDRLGGTRMAFANFEYIWNFAPEAGLNLVPFFDVGFNVDTDQSYSISDELKKSMGLEMRWRSPMGDLRFSYGWPLDEDWKGDRQSGRFEFSMGQFF
ncbi:MAG: outer membrane protein assembly factor BamA [Deltaproteobacteria bacterium]|jgi:outer membrane protein insertion porin family|nr:outer membrane protein assembly factor BamA [Deltaproteobacteria bacterium]